VLCVVRDERVFLIDYSEAFSTSADLPDHCDDGPFEVPPELAEALRGLDQQSLAADFSGLLSERQIEALLARRDEILGVASARTQ